MTQETRACARVTSKVNMYVRFFPKPNQVILFPKHNHLILMPKPHQVGFMPKLYQTAAIEHVAETRKGHITNPACVKKKQQKKHGQKT